MSVYFCFFRGAIRPQTIRLFVLPRIHPDGMGSMILAGFERRMCCQKADVCECVIAELRFPRSGKS